MNINETHYKILKAIESLSNDIEIEDKICLSLWNEHLKDTILMHSKAQKDVNIFYVDKWHSWL